MKVHQARLVPAACIALGIFVFCASAGVRAQSRSSSSRTAPADLSGVNSMIRDLRSRLTSLEQENDRLKKQLAKVEDRVGVLDGKVAAKASSSTMKMKPVKNTGLPDNLVNWAEFRNRVLAVMKPELDPMKAQLVSLGGHTHTFEKAMYSYGTLAVVKVSEGVLLPYVNPHNQGKAGLVETSGPQMK